MGHLTFIGILRRGKSTKQITLNIPRKYNDIVSVDKLVHVRISNERNDLKAGEMIHFDKDEKMI